MLVLKAIAYSPGSPVLDTVDKLSESTSEPPSLSESPLVIQGKEGGRVC